MTISRRDFLAAASGLGARLVAAPLAAAPAKRIGAPAELANLPSGVSCNGLRRINAWQVGSSIVMVCGFGSDPVELGGGRWRGSGVSVRHARDSQTECLLESSEAEFDIDYWMDDRGLHVIQYTFSMDAHMLVPLLEHRFDVREFPAHPSLSVMLQAPADAVKRLTDGVSALRRPRRGRPSDLYENFYRIRDFGLVDPDHALRELNALRGAWWDDGEVAELATSVRRELELLAMARGDHRA